MMHGNFSKLGDQVRNILLKKVKKGIKIKIADKIRKINKSETPARRGFLTPVRNLTEEDD